MPLGANLDSQIEAQTPLIAIAHQRNIPVIYSTVIYKEPTSRTPAFGPSR